MNNQIQPAPFQFAAPVRTLGDRVIRNLADRYDCWCCKDSGFVITSRFDKFTVAGQEISGCILPDYDPRLDPPIYCAAFECSGRKLADGKHDRPEGGVDYSRQPGFREACQWLHDQRYNDAVQTAQALHEKRKLGQDPELGAKLAIAEKVREIVGAPTRPDPGPQEITPQLLAERSEWLKDPILFREAIAWAQSTPGVVMVSEGTESRFELEEEF